MKVEEIAEEIAKLPPDHTDHAEELDSTATKFGRLVGRTFAEFRKRAKEP